MFVAALNPFRIVDDSYRSFVALLVGELAAGLANAHAYEEERRRVEALAAIDRAKTTFFSNVSHEFRTPLTLMLGPVEDGLADHEHPLSPSQQERLELVRRNGLRLLKLVNTLLDFSRIEAGRVACAIRAGRSLHVHDGSGQHVSVGHGACGARFSGRGASRSPCRSTSTATCGKRSS